MSNGRPVSTRNLLPSESRFASAMQQLGYGRFEFLRIELGELVLDPWPSMVRNVRFASPLSSPSTEKLGDFDLKKQVSEFFGYVRSLDAAEILTLHVHNGLPFSMEIEQHETNGGRRA
jgi:hypothetical protein